MASLLTLTANPLAEFTGTYKTDTPGQTHRASSEQFQVGGKGINVARMAQRLGLKSIALYLAGGILGDLCEEWLVGQPFQSKRIHVGTPTRSGWVVRTERGPETSFLGEDRPVSLRNWERATVQAVQAKANTLALCGSIPGWTEDHARLLEETWFRGGNGRTCYLDTYGAPLRSLSRLPWAAIKINRDELAPLRPPSLPPEAPVHAILPQLAEASQARLWIITDGAKPVSVFSKAEGYLEIEPPAVKAVSPTGSGDVFLAAFIHAQTGGKDLRESATRAAALAAANAAHPGVAEFALEAGAHRL